jgi:hypothetical protein
VLTTATRVKGADNYRELARKIADGEVTTDD